MGLSSILVFFTAFLQTKYALPWVSLFGGASGDAEWQQILKKIKDKFRWGDWEEDTFTQCGVLMTDDSDS